MHETANTVDLRASSGQGPGRGSGALKPNRLLPAEAMKSARPGEYSSELLQISGASHETRQEYLVRIADHVIAQGDTDGFKIRKDFPAPGEGRRPQQSRRLGFV